MVFFSENANFFSLFTSESTIQINASKIYNLYFFTFLLAVTTCLRESTEKCQLDGRNSVRFLPNGIPLYEKIPSLLDTRRDSTKTVKYVDLRQDGNSCLIVFSCHIKCLGLNLTSDSFNELKVLKFHILLLQHISCLCLFVRISIISCLQAAGWPTAFVWGLL